MSYRPLIKKSDFKIYFKFSDNIKDNEIDLHIRDAQEVEFFSWCDTDFYNDITGTLTNRPQLETLLNNYIKPYLIACSYYKFLLWHGRNVSQFGLRVNNEDTSVELSDKARAELLADVEHKKNIYLNKLTQKIYNDGYLYDGITYTFYDDSNKSNPKNTMRIKQVGRLKLPKGKFDGCC